MENFDAIILGCGPGGMEAASMLLRHGKKIAIVEKGAFGGVCLNCGCIPTKMMLGAIEPDRLLADLAKRRLAAGEVKINYRNLQTRIQRHIEGASAAIANKYKEKGAELFFSTGKLAGEGKVYVGDSDKIISAPFIIVATGSSPGFFPDLVADHKAVLDSTDLMFIDNPPESLCIVGAGAIGLEMADFFSAMGSKITLVEAAPQLAPTEDIDIAEILKQTLQKSGYTIHVGVSARAIATVDNKARLELSDGTIITTEKALVATGRQPNSSAIDCSSAGISLDKRGYIKVDENLFAGSGIYAVGDVNGKNLLAHAASQQANYVARRILGWENNPYSTGPVPSCIYCHPAIMRAGLSERDALKTGGVIEVSKSMFGRNPMAQAHSAPEGFVKAVWKDGKLAGMAAIGVNATQLVTAAELLVANGYDTETLEKLMVTHPSLDESLAGAIYGPREKIQ